MSFCVESVIKKDSLAEYDGQHSHDAHEIKSMIILQWVQENVYFLKAAYLFFHKYKV